MSRREGRKWPGWLEPLRPDEVARRRVRAAILRRAAPALDARRLGSWQDVAAGWASMLAPIAAVLLLFFAGLAYQASPGTIAASPVMLEELIQDEDPEGSLGALTSSAEPSPDWALMAVMGRERVPPRPSNGTPPGESR